MKLNEIIWLNVVFISIFLTGFFFASDILSSVNYGIGVILTTSFLGGLIVSYRTRN